MRTISMLALAAAVIFGAASCIKNTENCNEEGNAQLTINCDFSKAIESSEGAGTRAATSTAKPTTNWNTNIKSLTLILTNTSGVITHVLPANLPTVAGITQQTIATASNLVQATYDVYLIANAEASIVASPHGTAGTAPSWTLNPATLVGKNISTLNFGMVAAATAGLPAGITSANIEPTEIFWDKKTIAVGSTPATVTLALERSVSLLRVRINKDHADALGMNSGVTFDNATASLVLRKTAGTSILAATGLVGGTADATMFSKKPFKTANPLAADYNPVNMGLGTDYTFWNDYLILPGGAADVNTGFNIVVTGLAPANYVARDSQTGVETSLPSGGPVFWTAAVNGVVLKNNILELNLELKSKGATGTITPPASFGELTIHATVKDWGAITSVTIPI